jgi:integrase
MRGHIRKRGPDTWALVVYLGTDDAGKKRYVWRTVHGSKREADEALSRILADGKPPTARSAKRTVAEHLRKWIVDVATQRVSPKTLHRYKGIVEHSIIPALGEERLNRLRPESILRAYQDWLKGGLSAQTVTHFHRVLKQALKAAVRWGELTRNPVDLVDPPRVERKQPARLDESMAFPLIEKLVGHRVHAAAVLAISTGMRRGEILALRWADVDLERGMLSVTRSLEQVKRELRFKDCKSRRGRRQIALPAFAIASLRTHKAAQNEIRLRTATWYHDSDLIVCCDNGDPWAPDYMSNAFVQALASRKLPHIRFHDLRHAHASWLLRQGIHPKVVSERLGHSTVAITLDVYSHVLPGMQEDAALRLENALSAPGFAKDLQEPEMAAVIGLPGIRRKPVK